MQRFNKAITLLVCLSQTYVNRSWHLLPCPPSTTIVTPMMLLPWQKHMLHSLNKLRHGDYVADVLNAEQRAPACFLTTVLALTDGVRAFIPVHHQEIVSSGSSTRFFLNLCSLTVLPVRRKFLHSSCSCNSHTPTQHPYGIHGRLLPPVAQQFSYSPRRALAFAADCSNW